MQIHKTLACWHVAGCVFVNTEILWNEKPTMDSNVLKTWSKLYSSESIHLAQHCECNRKRG